MDTEPRIVFFDLETQKLSNEVGGWKNAAQMLIAVAVIYDTIDNYYSVYTEDTVDDLVDHLARADLVVGFNLNSFDYKVLGAYTNVNLNELHTFDMLEDVERRRGHKISLENLALPTLNKGKSADGLLAIEWFKTGNYEDLISYCRQDVAATKGLFFYGLENACIYYNERDGSYGGELTVDWNLAEMI